MAIAVGINSDQGQTLVTYRSIAGGDRASQLFALAPYNVPSQSMRTVQAAFSLPLSIDAPVRATQAQVLAVVKGRVANPQIRVFTFTLDEHDYYGIRLGDTGTILYDTYSQQWVEWTSETDNFWRVNCAINWVGAQKLAFTLGAGTDILVGDDTWGLLYLLDPTQAYDDHPNYLNPSQQIPFPRIVMTQTTVQGRENVPCYVIFLDTDNYGLSVTDFVPNVELEFSDDQGQTFISAGSITDQPNTSDLDYRWYSLGQMSSPGRLFRITDNGLLTRIDAMQMNDG